MKIKDTEVWGFRKAIIGCRNPKNSWGRMDSTCEYKENSENINSYINNTKVYMYQDNDSYLAIFNYNGINFVLESNIEKEEFIKILKSIIR